MDGACAAHIAHERAIARHDARLDSHGEGIDQLRECVTRLTALQEADAAWRADAERRLDALEAAPGERWEAVARTAATAVTSGLVGFALASLGID